MKKIANYIPQNIQEEKDKELMLLVIEHFPEQVLERTLTFGHLSSSAMIFNPQRDKVLMIYHNIYHNWTMTGGHADGEADLLKLAIKEAEEETGVTSLRVLSEDPVSLEVLSVDGHYKNGEYVAAHLHLNVTFAFEADESASLHICEGENSGVAWLPIDKLDQYSNETVMLEVFDKVIERVKRESL